MIAGAASAQDLAAAIRRRSLKAAEAAPAVRGADWRLATVSTVNADGTVVTSDGITARRLDTYPAPAVGDQVKLTQASNGNWLALGRVVSTAGDGWTALPLVGTWVANGGANDPVPTVRITTDGELQLSGMVKGTAVAAGANANVGTVPAGLLPTWWISGVAATSNAQNYARIRIDPSTGTVSLTNGSVALTTSSWVVLDSIRGRAR